VESAPLVVAHFAARRSHHADRLQLDLRHRARIYHARSAAAASGRRTSRSPEDAIGKAIGLLLAVAAIWVTAEIYTQGADHAFGGRFATWIGSGDAPHESRGSAAQRAGNAVGRARQEHDERYDALLPSE